MSRLKAKPFKNLKLDHSIGDAVLSIDWHDKDKSTPAMTVSYSTNKALDQHDAVIIMKSITKLADLGKYIMHLVQTNELSSHISSHI